MTNEKIHKTNRPYDSAWGMYYDEFDNAKPDEIKTWVRNHKDIDVIGYKLADEVNTIIENQEESDITMTKYNKNELIEKEVVRRIIDSPRTKKQMLDMLESIEPIKQIIQNQEEMDRIRTAHLFGTLGGCYTSNSTDNKEK